MMTEHSTTRRQLFNRIRQDHGRNGSPNSGDFVNLAQECLLRIFGLPPDGISKRTEREVKKTCEDFAYELKRNWNSKRINRHMDQLEKYHKDFLDQTIIVKERPDEEEDDKPEEDEDEPQDDDIQVNPFHSTSTPMEPKPKKSKVDHNTPFNEKVIFYIFKTTV